MTTSDPGLPREELPGRGNTSVMVVDGVVVEDCASEPIHVPGSVQPHAAVAVVADGVVVQHSTNLADVLRLDRSGPDAINGSRLDDLLGDDAARVPDLAEADRGRARVVVRLERGGEGVEMSCPVSGEVSILQFEPVTGSVGTDASFQGIVTDAVSLVQGAESPQQVVEIVCRFVRDLTGFDRVMAYRFEDDDHGVVIAEEHVEGVEPFLDLHYPATDIPAQARRMYLDHWIRLIPDSSYEPVPIVPTTTPTTGEPLDLSDVAARSVSPVHCEYLRNMGVASSMSLSIVVEERLWGLFACHHYSGPRRPSREVRDACEFVALTASVMIGAKEAHERTRRRLEIQGLVHRVEQHLDAHDDVVGGLRAAGEVLLELGEADGVSIVLGDRVETVGTCPSPEFSVAVTRACADTAPNEIVATDRVLDLPLHEHGWSSDPGASEAALDVSAGVMVLPLSSAIGNSLLFHRPRWEREMRWAGRPDKAVRTADDGSSRLVPRSSFAEWVETVRDRSRPWAQDHHEAIETLRTVLAGHITRTIEEMARINSELTRSNAELDAFAYVASHDLREPLRGIANYASFLLEDYEDVLEGEGRSYLRSMAELTTRMNSLLGSLLDYARIGQSDLHRSVVTVADLVDDVRPLVAARLEETNAEVAIVDGHDVELDVDRDLIGQVLMNLITNAVKYTERDRPRVEVGVTTLAETGRGLAIVRDALVSERVRPVVFVRDDGIGIASSMVEDIFRVFRRLHAKNAFGGGSGAGLTIARRIVTRHGGAIWVESTPGEGSTFFFTTEGGES